MKQEDKELLIKEISSRLPYGIKAQVLEWNEEKGEIKVPLKVYSIDTDGCVYFESNDYDVYYVDVESCLLYLRPMSSMTEEERNEYTSLCDRQDIDTPTWSKVIWYDTYKSFDWLNAHHFDYRGLIENGIAIEAHKEIYNLND